MGPEAYILIDHAYEAYRQGRFIEAGVLAGQTCNDAKKAGKDELAYELGLFEVQCLLRAGKPLGALNRLLTMESWQAPLHEYLFQMKEQTFDLLRSYNPDVTQLETRLGELERLARSALDGVVADFRLYEYLYLEDQGKDEKALNSIELAWSERGAGTMNHAHSTASYGCLVNLRLNRRPQAEDWVKIMERDGEITCLGYRADLADCKAELALFDGRYEDVFHYAQQQRRVAMEYADKIRVHEAIEKQVRSRLLDATNGDPVDRLSGVLDVFKQAIPGKNSLQLQFRFSLLLLDIRLAAVRWAVGMQPAEDSWYQSPQVVACDLRVAKDEAIRRIDKTQAAIRRAGKIARQSDQAFCCDWRQEAVNHRRERLQKIVSNLDQGVTSDFTVNKV
ncbi:hypothetical protein Mal35_36480 [Gimesia maris]|uniref:hypothetical protein n=1 Tax=Gimesia maris TaxID=122 RepID=UPI0011895322|nr:hypothetical protein [Gimesia maris]QDT80177.1 hypothetical protein Mal35_36480 [Gimesia maris]